MSDTVSGLVALALIPVALFSLGMAARGMAERVAQRYQKMNSDD